MSRFPDPARSRAVILGAGRFLAPELTDLPAVRENVTALHDRLSDPRTGVLTRERCVVAGEQAGLAEVGQLVGEQARQAGDLLLVYYAGHGLVDDRGRLHLALHGTNTSALRYSALPVDLLREDIGASPAAARVLILDCCFAGRAIEVMGTDAGLFSAQFEVAGTYTLASTTATAPAYAPRDQRFTAFTGALLEALSNGTPLTLDELYARVDRKLVARGLPRPQRRATNTAGELYLSRGPGRAADTTDPAPPQAVFRLDPAVRRNRQRRVLFTSTGWMAGVSALGAVLFAVLNGDPGWLVAAPFYAGCAAALCLLIYLLQMITAPKQAELVVDGDGITIVADSRRRTVRWTEISDVGVLRPQPRTVNPRLKAVYAANHLLVVHYRPEVATPPGGLPALSRQLHDLGYLALGPIGAFGADREQLLAALARFAGPRLFRTERELLSRDPRVPPHLV
jgi:hypothetical protein